MSKAHYPHNCPINGLSVKKYKGEMEADALIVDKTLSQADEVSSSEEGYPSVSASRKRSTSGIAEMH